MNKTKILTIIGSALLTVLVGVLFVFADWSAAPASPPSNNIAAPIDMSTTPQSKSGPLTVRGLTIAGTGNGITFPDGSVLKSADGIGTGGGTGTTGTAGGGSEKGDVNNDGVVNCYDLSDITAMAVGTKTPTAASDVDGDGTKATITDLNTLSQLLKTRGISCAAPADTTRPAPTVKTTAGAYEVVVPANAASTIKVYVWGGGGGGAYGRWSDSIYPNYKGAARAQTAGSGGGSGGFVSADISGIRTGDTLKFVVGQGGVGSPRPMNTGIEKSFGNPGGSSWFASADGKVLTATGGIGGADFDNWTLFWKGGPTLAIHTAGWNTPGGAGSATPGVASVTNVKTRTGNSGQVGYNASQEDYTGYATGVAVQTPVFGGLALTESLLENIGYGAGGNGANWGSYNTWKCTVAGVPAGTDYYTGDDGNATVTPAIPGYDYYPGASLGIPCKYGETASVVIQGDPVGTIPSLKGQDGAVIIKW